MNILEQTLADSKKNKSIIGIRMYGDNTKFWCGYIIDFNLELILIQHFSKNGLADGFILAQIENVESIDVEDNYSKSFKELSSKIEQNYNSPFTVKLPKSNNWQFEFLSNYNNIDKVIAIEFDSDFSIEGRVMELDDTFLKIEPISDLGEIDGFSIYRTENIESIFIDSIESIKRNKMLKMKN